MSDNTDIDTNNDINIIEISHKINEIMQFFKKEDVIDILTNCVQSMIMIPRFELISTIDILSEYMLKDSFNNEFNQKVNSIRKQAETWVFSPDNRNFSRIWRPQSKQVPEKIHEMYQDIFDMNVYDLIEKYVKDIITFSKQIEDKKADHLRKWLSQSVKEYEKEYTDLGQRHLKELEIEKEQEARREHDKNFVSGKTFKERQKEQEEMLKTPPKITKKMEQLEKISKITSMKYMDNIQEMKKADKERFGKIFYAFDKKFHKLSDETKNMIMTLWYGNFFAKEDVASDDILSIVRRHSLRFKIPNDHINGEVNKLILQTYILGLYEGISVLDIYTIINYVLETNPTMTTHKIIPNMIHENGIIPTPKIQEVLNPIIKNLPLNVKQQIIRSNWHKLCFPSIDIYNLFKYIEGIRMDKSLKFTIIKSIEDESTSENIIKEGLTIEKYARNVYKILKEQKMKIPITEKEIIDLLKPKPKPKPN